ncbi:uncharacterized protein TRIADDRAFT_25239 [Trichoplax adhaerens]|uniref:Cytochrome P450 n=1 Tax=Trichoplax adhaerens TaxID=10228 RepID=B3RXJ9_TRIAD|nr:hypothetical protein TRIADDRAFT_25239 [Trichoplax adhaerens]EDV24872.1 hypothetical protein TRIADDRAFT_25239 [Trichoplax adhaerens]|eukprot:XP_002112762.1 hypothetical protein TRIADDRAFT_25239 [Trichoplax adhaerens]
MALQELLTSSISLREILLPIVMVLLCYGFIHKLYDDYYRPYRRLRKCGLKMPIPKPFAGNVMDYGSRDQHTAQIKRQELYGNVYGTFIFCAPTIWIGDPEMLKAVMVKDFANFTNRYALVSLMRPFDKTLLRLTNKDWKRVRTTLVPTFSASKLKTILPFIRVASDNLVDKLFQVEVNRKAVNIWQVCGQFTMRVILATAFGIEFESEEHEAKITKAAGMILRDTNTFVQFFVVYASPLFKILEPVVGGDIMKSINLLTETIEQVICQRRKNLKEGIPCRKDILQHMIEAGNSDNISDEEIIAQAVIFLIAGHETTANTLALASYSLATNPETQEKLITEIDDKCPNASNLDYETLSTLPYLEMVISETLRMYPAGFFVNRCAKEDIIINGVDIPKNSMIGLPIYAVHHNPQFWPDPECFIPERFTPEAKAKHHPYSYIPFGGGPRNCIGMRLALLETKFALVRILQNVKLVVVKETEIPLKLKTGATLSPANGVYVGIQRRH